MAKIEKPQAVDDLEAIVGLCDAIMVARWVPPPPHAHAPPPDWSKAHHHYASIKLCLSCVKRRQATENKVDLALHVGAPVWGLQRVS